MYGQMTAGSWIYIGTQGILQGTYETFAQAARAALRRRRLAGKLVLTAGLGGMGGAQPLAVTMNDGVAHRAWRLTRTRIERRLATALPGHACATAWTRRSRLADEASREREPLSIGLLGNAAESIPEMVRRGIVPDMVHRPDLGPRSPQRLHPAGL